MKYLMTQEEFEQLLGRGEAPTEPLPAFTVVYFTATWCGACRSVNVDMLESELPTVNWLKCDVDQNVYTPGYCGVRSIPTFVAIHNTKLVGQLQSNDTLKIMSWAKNLMNQSPK